MPRYFTANCLFTHGRRSLDGLRWLHSGAQMLGERGKPAWSSLVLFDLVVATAAVVPERAPETEACEPGPGQVAVGDERALCVVHLDLGMCANFRVGFIAVSTFSPVLSCRELETSTRMLFLVVVVVAAGGATAAPTTTSSSSTVMAAERAESVAVAVEGVEKSSTVPR